MNFYKDIGQKRLSLSDELTDYLRFQEEEHKSSWRTWTAYQKAQARHRWAVEFLKRKGVIEDKTADQDKKKEVDNRPANPI